MKYKESLRFFCFIGSLDWRIAAAADKTQQEGKHSGSRLPVSIVLPCGHFFRIDRVLHYAVSPDEYEGLRFTVMIGGEEKYIYRSGDSWYIFADRKGGNR